MSTEHKNELETNALADRLGRGWEQFKQGKLVSYRIMALFLLVVAAIGVFIYIRAEQGTAAARAWAELEGATSVASLEELAKNGSSTTGKVAQLQLARYYLGPDGIDKLASREEGERKKAVENVEKARDMLAKLADEFKNDTDFRAECYGALSAAETALVGVPKEGSTTDYRGTVEKVTEWLDKFAAAAEGTPWGDDAKKRSEALKTNPKVKDDLTAVQRAMYKQGETPQLPGLGSLPPTGGGFPFTPGVPGVPGGALGGALPPSTPVVIPTPGQPPAPPAPPAGPAPVAPAPGTQPAAPPPAAPVAPPKTPPMPGATAPAAPPATPPAQPAPPVPPKK